MNTIRIHRTVVHLCCRCSSTRLGAVNYIFRSKVGVKLAVIHRFAQALSQTHGSVSSHSPGLSWQNAKAAQAVTLLREYLQFQS